MQEQEVKDFDIYEELTLEPEYVTTFTTNTFLQRTIAHLFGYYEGKWRKVRVDANGSLLVTSTEKAIEKYDVLTLIASDEESIQYTFTLPPGVSAVRTVDIYVMDGPCYIRLIPTDDTVLPQFILPSQSWYSVDGNFKGIKVQAVNPGESVNIQVIGWW
ncbi:MAG: hypothetical protein QXU79_01605 [Candidatus Micrarchaeaceae archaeon]